MEDAMSDDLERRLTELEQRLSFSDRMAEELSGVVAEQGRLIEALDRKLSELRKRFEETVTWQPAPQDEQQPPHY
jgi:SlyX protein